jgi:hypothetical protein
MIAVELEIGCLAAVILLAMVFPIRSKNSPESPCLVSLCELIVEGGLFIVLGCALVLFVIGQWQVWPLSKNMAEAQKYWQPAISICWLGFWPSLVVLLAKVLYRLHKSTT